MTGSSKHYLLQAAIKWLSISLSVVFLVFSSAHAASDSAAKSAKAADFTLKDLEGRVVKLSHFKGQVVLINFWTTWCPPCRAEIPDFIALYEKYRQKGFTVIGISLDEASTAAARKILSSFIEKAGITYPILVGDDAVSEAYGGIYAVPTSFLIDTKGNIAKKYTGAPKKEILEKDLLSLLKNKGSFSSDR